MLSSMGMGIPAPGSVLPSGKRMRGGRQQRERFNHLVWKRLNMIGIKIRADGSFHWEGGGKGRGKGKGSRG